MAHLRHSKLCQRTPQNLASTVSFSVLGEFANRATISTYDNWIAPQTGKFDPNKDSYMQPQDFLPDAAHHAFGNSTRFNPKFRSIRQFFGESIFVQTFNFKERPILELRGEAFNVLNAFGSAH